MPTYYAVAGGIELLPTQYKFGYKIEKFHTVSEDLLEHVLDQSFKFRCCNAAPVVSKIYLFSDETDAYSFATQSLPNEASVDCCRKHYPIFTIETQDEYLLSLHITTDSKLGKNPVALSYCEMEGDELKTLRNGLKLTEISLPHYKVGPRNIPLETSKGRNNENPICLYYPDDIMEEYRRPLFDKNFFIIVASTFVTIIIPIIYIIYRLWKESDTNDAVSETIDATESRHKLADQWLNYENHIKSKKVFPSQTNVQDTNPALIPSSPPLSTAIPTQMSTSTETQNTSALLSPKS